MFKEKRKSQSLSINVIIIAALALIVLIIIAAIFTGRIKIFSSGLASCAAKQGTCENPSNGDLKFPKCEDNNKAAILNTDCENIKKTCCIQVLSQ